METTQATMTEQSNTAIKEEGNRTFAINREALYDPETRPLIFAELIRRVCPTAKNVHLALPNGETINLTPKRILHLDHKANGGNDWVSGGIGEEEYSIEKALIQNLGGKDVSKKGHTPYVYHAKDDGSVEYTIPAGSHPVMKGEIKHTQHLHERKWSVQARLRARVLAKGGKLNDE